MQNNVPFHYNGHCHDKQVFGECGYIIIQLLHVNDLTITIAFLEIDKLKIISHPIKDPVHTIFIL